MAERELSFCYFNDLPENERPELVVCNECGFVVSYVDGDATVVSDCRYRLCPFASPERCRDCDYMEFEDENSVGRCAVPPSMLKRYLHSRRKRRKTTKKLVSRPLGYYLHQICN